MKKKYILPIIFCSYILIFFVLTLALPKAERSVSEKRILKTYPEFSMESLKSGSYMKDFDEYVADHFAFREKWVGLYSYATLFLGQNGASGVYSCNDGYLISAPLKYSESQADKNLSNFKRFAENNNLEYFIMPVPTTGYIMDDVLPKFHKYYYDDEVFKLIEQKNMPLIDLREEFSNKKNDGQIYYKTDHHITSFGASILYSKYCEQMKLEPKEFSTTYTAKDFYGTSYSKSGLWLKKPDTIDLLETKDKSSFTVTFDNNEYDSLFFMDELKGDDKYQVFLGGNHDLTIIKNNSIKNGKKLLIVKDSFAHCFSTLLAENYEELYLIDLRYYRKSTKKLIEENDISNVLFLYGIENIATSTDTGWLNY